MTTLENRDLKAGLPVMSRTPLSGEELATLTSQIVSAFAKRTLSKDPSCRVW
jgi:hypothetical protein